MPQLRFDKETHTYWLGERRLASVSSIVKRLTPEFDRERISLYVARKNGQDQADVLAEWDEARKQSIEKGELVHSYIDDTLGGGQLFASPPDLPECRAFDSAWAELKEKSLVEIIGREKVVYDERLGIAGRYDLLLGFTNRDSGSIARMPKLWDWKTGKYDTANRFDSMLPPFSDLPNCAHTKASMQTSLYRLLIERSDLSMTICESNVCHLRADGGYVIYRALDLRKRITEWLEKCPA